MDDKQQQFLELFEPVREKLYRFARALTKDDELAKDLVSETVLKTYESFEKIQKKRSFKSYVFTIASRSYKKYKWRRRFFGEAEDDVYENLVQNDSSEIAYDVEVLHEAMDTLPFKQKEAIALYEISGFSVKEVAEMQNASLTAVKSRLKRGREKLAKLLNTKESQIDKPPIPIKREINNKYNLRIEK